MKNNAFNALLGTELPIIQAPMAGVQDSQMAIAVSNVGGLGSLPCGMLNKDAIVKELQLIQQATNRPFNLNFFCHEMPEYDANKHEEWQKTLQPYFAEVGAIVQAQPNAPTRMPFNHDIADAIEPFAPPVISFHFGLPADDLLARIRGWGGRSFRQRPLWMKHCGWKQKALTALSLKAWRLVDTEACFYRMIYLLN